jgi:predicted RNase H-like nuclease (RuvC/YqgF family)
MAAVPHAHDQVNVLIRAGGRVAKWRGGWAADRVRRKVRAEISQHAKKGMNGFVLYSWANIELKYDC